MNLVDISRMLENLIRVGTIEQVDHANAKCRVKTGNLTTEWLSWIERRAGNTRTWEPPTVGEQVLIFSPSGVVEKGFVITGLFSLANPAPSDSADEHLIHYPDGAVISYNHVTHALTASGIATANIQASTSITLDTPATYITGTLDIDGLLTYHDGMQGNGGSGSTAVINGDVNIAGISFLGHIHPEHDGGNTGAPL